MKLPNLSLSIHISDRDHNEANLEILGQYLHPLLDEEAAHQPRAGGAEARFHLAELSKYQS